jgi:Protein of unknown function (DUF3892)
MSQDKGRRIVDARADSKGNIEAVRFEGNKNFTAVERAVPIVARGGSPNAHVVHPQAGDPHLRTNPDRSKGNNLDEMAKK